MSDQPTITIQLTREEAEGAFELAQIEARSPRSLAFFDGLCDKLRVALDSVEAQCTTFDCTNPSVASCEIEDTGWYRYCEECTSTMERGGYPTKWDSPPSQSDEPRYTVGDLRRAVTELQGVVYGPPGPPPADLDRAIARVAGCVDRLSAAPSRGEKCTCNDNLDETREGQ